MKLIVFNGSPRGKNSNSSVIIKWLLEGAVHYPDFHSETVFLNKPGEQENNAGKVRDADMILFVFPLYTDCMPGIVAAFFEKLQPYVGKLNGKKMGFVVHSGFVEAHHSRFIEKHLVWLTGYLGADYMGTVVKGGSEAFHLMPESMNKKTKVLFNKLGEAMLKDGKFDEAEMKKLASPEKLTGFTLLLYKILSGLGVMNIYFNAELKKNNAIKNSYARPFME